MGFFTATLKTFLISFVVAINDYFCMKCFGYSLKENGELWNCDEYFLSGKFSATYIVILVGI